MKTLVKYITTYEVDNKTGEKIFVNEELYIEPKLNNIKSKLINQDTISSAFLYDKKLALSESAINELKANIGDRLNIRYEQCNKIFVPVIYKSTSSSGTKLGKNYTIAYSGENAKALTSFGKEFKLIKFGEDPLRFMLLSNSMNITQEDINNKNCIDKNIKKLEDEINNEPEKDIFETWFDESSNELNIDNFKF